MNQMIFSTFHLSPQNLPDYLATLRAFEPAVLDGYPSSLYVQAKLLLNRDERLPLRAAITSSETLFDFQRQAIEAAFECRVFDYYAAAERVVFTVECDRHEGHHLCEEYGIAEFVDDVGQSVPDGTEGFMVGTTLHNLGMPLIRYRTTDRGARKSAACSCGVGPWCAGSWVPLQVCRKRKRRLRLNLRPSEKDSPVAVNRYGEKQNSLHPRR